MEASREFPRTPRRLPPCSEVSVLQKTRISQFWDTHHTDGKAVPCRLEILHRTRPKSLENGIKHATRPRIERQLAKQG